MNRDDSSDITHTTRQESALVERILGLLDEGRAPNAELLATEFPETVQEIEHLVAVVRLVRGGAQLKGRAGKDLHDLGDFQIVREIGRGGMGVVYEARQLSLDRRVALKVLLPGVSIDPQALQRFQREAETAGGLRHRHIVPIYATGEHGGLPYYAMQYIDGEALSVERAATTAAQDRYRQIARWGLQVAEALEHAHGAGVVHRDIKPANLLLDPEGQVWVTDFGLAWRSNQDSLTMTGDVLGTVRYMSPEQARGGGRVDARSDIYSLGVSLYELTAARPPFAGPDRESTLKQVLLDDPPRLRRLDQHVPAPLEQIIQRTMQKAAEDRYPTAGALREDLQRFLDDRPLLYRPPGLLGQVQRLARRHRRATQAIAATFVVCVLFAIAMTLLFARASEMRITAAQGREDARLARAQAVSARAQAERRRGEAEQVQLFLQDMLASIDPEFARARDTAVLLEVLSGASGRIDADLGGQPGVAAVLHETIGRMLTSLHVYDEAEEHLEHARSLLAETGADDLAVRRSLAELLFERGAWGEAEVELRNVLSALESQPERRRLRLETTEALARLLIHRERMDEAEAYLLTLQQEAADPPIELLLVQAEHGLGMVAHVGRDLETALATYQQAERRAVAVLGDNHPETLRIQLNIVAALRDLDRLDEAEELVLGLEVARREVHGPDSLEVWLAQHAHAALQVHQDKPAQALETLEDLHPKVLEKLGARHPISIMLRHDLGLALREADQLQRGEVLLSEALDLAREELGAEYSLAQSALANLVTLLHIQKRFHECVPLYVELMKLEVDEREAGVETSLSALNNFVYVLIRLGEDAWARGKQDDAMEWFAEAEEWARESLALRVQHYGASDGRTMIAKDNLGIVLQAIESYDEAVELFRDILAARVESLGEEHMMTLIARTRLADLLGEVGDYAEAHELQTISMESAKTKFHPRDIRWAILKTNHGFFLSGLGRYEEAEPFLLEAYERVAEMYGYDSTDIAETRLRIIEMYEAWGRPEAADPYRQPPEEAVQP